MDVVDKISSFLRDGSVGSKQTICLQLPKEKKRVIAKKWSFPPHELVALLIISDVNVHSSDALSLFCATADAAIGTPLSFKYAPLYFSGCFLTAGDVVATKAELPPTSGARPKTWRTNRRYQGHEMKLFSVAIRPGWPDKTMMSTLSASIRRWSSTLNHSFRSFVQAYRYEAAMKPLPAKLGHGRFRSSMVLMFFALRIP